MKKPKNGILPIGIPARQERDYELLKGCAVNFMADLPKNFLEFSAQLNAHKVRYLIVGGYAVIYHGYPRSTVDFDVFVAMDRQNAEHLSHAIADFGFDPKEYSPDFFLTPSSILMIGREPWRIDIFTSIKGLDFEDAYKKRVMIEVKGIQIPFVARDDLIASKMASNRNRDRDDIRRLTPRTTQKTKRR